MPAMAASRPSDDFDMAKLQKTLKQRQRYSMRNSPHVAKLTAAEIRSLNHSALASKTGSQSSTKSTSSPAKSRRSTNATPPTTPDDPSAHQAQRHRNSVSRNPSVDVPTPPHTPSGHRRSSQSSTRGRHAADGHTPIHGHANGIIHAPRPRGSAQAAFMVANGVSSRPSSSGSSIHRGLPTYRGPEVTRTGSINMLQYPSHNIVNNPLSYFSRPRQSMASTSPERSRHDSQDLSIYRAQSLQNGRAHSLTNVSLPSSRHPSPPRVTDSPVSMIADNAEKSSVFDPAEDPHNQPKIHSDDEDAHIETKPTNVDVEPIEAPSSPAEKPKQIDQQESPKKEKEKQKRFTISSVLFGGDKGRDGSNENKLKKARRRTLSITKSQDTKPPPDETPTIEADHEHKVDGATIENSDITTHPAVRPLSLIIPSEFKGKETEIHSAPVYARCDCCGKLKRPPGYGSELSPVMENEHLRTNFSFEIERTSTTSRRSSNASRDKFIPIIPMEIGEGETRQATIEPYTGSSTPAPAEAVAPSTSQSSPVAHKTGETYIAQSTPVRQSKQHANSSPRRPKRNSDPPKFVRFASLHGRRHPDATVIAEEDEAEVNETQPLMSDQTNTDLAGVNTHDFATVVDDANNHEPVLENRVDKAAEHQTILDREIDRPVVGGSQHNQVLLTIEAADNVPHRLSNAGSGSEAFYTPARGTTPVIETQNPADEKQDAKKVPTAALPTTAATKAPDSHQAGSLLSLPDLSLGPNFAGSDSTLRDFVFSSGPTPAVAAAAGDLNGGEAGARAGDEKRSSKWVAEVVTVKA